MKREWPEAYKDLVVTLENGDKTNAVYTGDGWMINLPIIYNHEKAKVKSWNYLDEVNK